MNTDFLPPESDDSCLVERSLSIRSCSNHTHTEETDYQRVLNSLISKGFSCILILEVDATADFPGHHQKLPIKLFFFLPTVAVTNLPPPPDLVPGKNSATMFVFSLFVAYVVMVI